MAEEAQQLLTVLLLTYAAAVAGVDLATRRIPNGLTLVAAAVALPLSAMSGSAAGLASAVVGMAIALCAFLPMYLGGGLGAGDAKAMAVVGACVGVPGVFIAIGITLVAGAFAAIAVLVMSREVVPAAQRMHANLLLARTGAIGTIRPAPGSAASHRFPYGVAIAAGALAAAWWTGRLEVLFVGGLR